LANEAQPASACRCDLVLDFTYLRTRSVHLPDIGAISWLLIPFLALQEIQVTAVPKVRTTTRIKSVLVHVPDSDTALQALVSPLAPGQNSSARTSSKGDVSKLFDKLKEPLGDVDPPQESVRRNEGREVRPYTGVD
jgi:hypothetical protein